MVEDDADNAIIPSSSTFITGVPDITGPQVVNVSSLNENKTYTIGDSIIITVEFDEIVIVSGVGGLHLELLTKDPSTPTYHSAAIYFEGSGALN